MKGANNITTELYKCFEEKNQALPQLIRQSTVFKSYSPFFMYTKPVTTVCLSRQLFAYIKINMKAFQTKSIYLFFFTFT